MSYAFYINRNRIGSLASVCINNKTPTETDKNEKFKPPTEETNYISALGGTGRIGNDVTLPGRKKSNGSQNRKLMDIVIN